MPERGQQPRKEPQQEHGEEPRQEGRAEHRRPTVDDVDPEALAVNAMDDETRTHRGEADETDAVQSTGGDVIPVDSEGHPKPSSRATGGSTVTTGETAGQDSDGEYEEAPDDDSSR